MSDLATLHWGPVRGSGDPSGSGLYTKQMLFGRTLGPGTHRFLLPCADASSQIATLHPVTVTGACTARVYTPLAKDSITENTSIATPAAIALAAGTQIEITTPTSGEHAQILELVVPEPGALLLDVADSRAISAGAAGGGTSTPTLAAGEAHVGEFGLHLANPSATFTRPNDTNPYTIGDLVANSVTAGSVAAMQLTLARVVAGSSSLPAMRLTKTGATTTAAVFRAHFYATDPAASSGIVNGDNGVWSTAGIANYIGSMDFDFTSTGARVFTDGVWVRGAKLFDSKYRIKLASGQIAYVLLEARGAYVPTGPEVFAIIAESEQN